MNIFEKIKNSIYNPKYYSEIIEKPFSYSLKYYLVFALLFALAFTVVATIRLMPIVNLLSEQATKIPDYFPQELTINIKDGKVLTNVQEPYFIKMPQDLKDNNADLDSTDLKVNGSNVQLDTTNMENIVVIDTKDKFDIDTFNSYKTFMLLTSDSIVYRNKDNQISISSLADVKDFTLNRDGVASFVAKAKPFLVILYHVISVLAYIFGFLAVLIKMIYLLLGALLVWLIAKIKGLKIGYGKSYQAGMHLMTSAIIITSILNAISAKFTFIFFFTLILILSAALNLRKTAVQPAIFGT